VVIGGNQENPNVMCCIGFKGLSGSKRKNLKEQQNEN
jgi:hypothetical protein